MKLVISQSGHFVLIDDCPVSRLDVIVDIEDEWSVFAYPFNF